MKKCDRCHKELTNAVFKMSWLNEQNICLSCSEEEENHSSFKFAKEVERDILLKSIDEINDKYSVVQHYLGTVLKYNGYSFLIEKHNTKSGKYSYIGLEEMII